MSLSRWILSIRAERRLRNASLSLLFLLVCVLVCACRTAATAETNLTPDMYYDAEGQLDEPRVKKHAGATRISKEEDF